MASIDRRSSGKYLARWREFPGGPQRTRTFTRKIDAEQFLVEVQHRLLSGTYTPPAAGQVTVAAYAAEWVARRSWAPSTYDRVASELRLHILPTLGPRPLSSLRRAHIEEWAKALPLSAASARGIFSTVTTMLNAAVDDERIPRNPARGARLAKADAVPFVPLTPDEVRGIAANMTEPFRAAVVLAAGTGLRQGEIFGITTDRLDFMRRELRIDRQLWSPTAGRPVLKAPKSANSYRTLALSTLVVDALAAHLGTYGPSDDGYVFHDRGQPVPRPMAARYLRRAVLKAGLKAQGWHAIRHHHASVLLSAGISPALVAERLGHDVKTLLTTYAHVIRNDDERVRAVVDASLGVSAEDWLRTEAV